MLVLFLDAGAQSFYRSKATGNWNAIATWESAPAAAGPWGNALATPTSADFATTIQSGHTVTINASVSIDEVTINLGGTLTATGAVTVTINNGVGVDLINNGTFIDNISGVGSIGFSGSRWSMASGATLIKTSGSASNNWQNNYQGGIATIPSNANWILRKIGAANPSISTTSPATGSVYPNLIIENNTGTAWAPAVGSPSNFMGNAAYPTIKGNLDIGGTGSNTVSFVNEHTNASPTLVLGNVFIKAGSTLRNFGTGLEIQGNLTVNGTISYDLTDARRLVFSGNNPQTVSGTGTANIWDMRMNKTANDLTMNKAITIDNQLDLTSGRIFTTNVNILTFIDVATVINTNNNSFVYGPVRKKGDNPFVFPVGKNSDYQPIGMSSGGISTITFWSEDFGTGCSQGNTGAGYSGPNGAWTQTNTVNDPQSNNWYVSATEAGMGTGNCGNGCLSNGSLTNRTLHVGANDGFVPTDPGAAYDAGGLCGILICVATDKRIESPLINCTGMSNINVSFNYMENGQSSTDNATLWYYDGSAWSNIYDMPKTTVCGSGQGMWTYTTITLPPSANNNPNVKIGFRWVNNDDGVGSDPSFAVDDIQLSVGSSDVFTAEYFRGNPTLLFGAAKDPSLVSISQCEYWQLDRNLGSSSRLVYLNWDGNSCGITNVANLRVARWDVPGAIWRDEGQGGGTTGTVAAGTIESGNFISTYGTFTLSAIDAQPLPVQLLAFDAVYNGNTVDVSWSTASEINNDHFTIERSPDALEFEPVGLQPGAGNSTGIRRYYFEDLSPLQGVSYYRLKQTDYDGTSKYCPPKKVAIITAGSFTVYSDHLNNQIIISTGNRQMTNGKIEVIDQLGRVIQQANLDGSQTYTLPMPGFSKGVYLARISCNQSVTVNRFVY